MSGADVEVYLSQVHDGSVSSGFRALYEERLLLDVTLLIEEHHFQVRNYSTCHTMVHLKDDSRFGISPPLTPFGLLLPLSGPQGAAGHPERLLPGHVHGRHEGAGPGQDPHEGADGCWVRPHSPLHVLRLAGAQHAHGAGDPAGNSRSSTELLVSLKIQSAVALRTRLPRPAGGHVRPADGGGGVLLLLPAG